MVKTILRWINYALASCAAVLAFLVVVMAFKGHSHSTQLPNLDSLPTGALAKSSFEQAKSAYNDIGNPVLATAVVPPTLELPDLRPFLNYYGTNDRPDSKAEAVQLFFSLKGSDAIVGVAPGGRIYLKYDATKRPGIYVFSAENQPTNLWLVAQKDDNKANIVVTMTDDAGKMITEPAIRGTMVLAAKDFARPGGGWEIGKWKVDGTLLARQRVRWFGQDQFLNRHGGPEFLDVRDKERIEFGDGNDRYVVYLKEGDCLIWDGQRWQTVRPGEATKTFPIMCVQKLEDRLMRLDLWDVGGQGHVSLNLVKSKEAWAPKSVEQDFKFVSTRTLSQYVFEVKKERMVLRPYDWLLQTDKGWKVLSTGEDIDAYVDRKSQGILFVFNGPVQKEGAQVLRGTLYSPARTETYEADFALDQASPILGGHLPEEHSEQNQSEEYNSSEQSSGPSSEQNASEEQPQDRQQDQESINRSVRSVRELMKAEDTHADFTPPDERSSLYIPDFHKAEEGEQPLEEEQPVEEEIHEEEPPPELAMRQTPQEQPQGFRPQQSARPVAEMRTAPRLTSIVQQRNVPIQPEEEDEEEGSDDDDEDFSPDEGVRPEPVRTPEVVQKPQEMPQEHRTADRSIPPKPARKPGCLRDDVKFLLHDKSK